MLGGAHVEIDRFRKHAGRSFDRGDERTRLNPLRAGPLRTRPTRGGRRSGRRFNAKTPDTPGHVFEVRYVPATETTPASATFTVLDGTGRFAFGDIPANSIIVSERGTIYVGTDFGVVQPGRFVPGWHRTAPGLPNTAVADLVLVPGGTSSTQRPTARGCGSSTCVSD